MKSRIFSLPQAALSCAVASLMPVAAVAQSAADARPPVTVSVGGGALMPYSVPRTADHGFARLRSGPGVDVLLAGGTGHSIDV